MPQVEQLATETFSLLSYVIRDDRARECLIVDPPADIMSRVRLNEWKIKAVINTHIHPDHTLGNRKLAGLAPVLAHSEENRWLLKCYNIMFTFLMSGRVQPAISFSLSENTPVFLGEQAIRILHTPGHSPGSICLYWDGNLISGDTIFVQGIGRTDLPGGSMPAMRESVTRLMGLPGETIVWPGHSYGGAYHATLGQIAPVLQWVVKTF
jgi:glyoxylase-like metal-dependent hydrolase (beta-lactamase superfamily II)